MTVEVSLEKPQERLIGEVLASRYQIESKIGEGAMGAVYRATAVTGAPAARSRRSISKTKSRFASLLAP